MRVDLATDNAQVMNGVHQPENRQLDVGFGVLIIEAASGLGGVWQWNIYPGARVDTHVPLYGYSIPELWKTWNWSQKYPSYTELHAYFKHVDKVLGLSKDVRYNTKVLSADFSDDTNQWTIVTQDGSKYTSSYFIPAMGFAANRHFPKWPGLDQFKGEVHHSSFWPREGLDVRGKRVAIVGTGSTGVQMVQEIGKDAKQLTLFQRTPNIALPLRQVELTEKVQERDRPNYPAKFLLRYQSLGGYDFSPAPINTFDHNAEERRAFYEDKWEKGGFLFWSGAYQDLILDLKANREAYDFWLQKIRPMIKDQRKRDLVAPLEPPHPFGAKRAALFTTYYDVLDQNNVNIVDVKTNPVDCVVENGIVTEDGELHEFDVLALATGFDAITGSLKQITVRNGKHITLNEKWSVGTKTYLGLMTRGFPNMFFTYGPQGPTAFSNGPTAIEMQGDWVVELLVRAREAGWMRIDPAREAEESYSQLIHDLTYKTLLPLADSYWMGANVEGKKKEGLNFPGGVPEYYRLITESAAFDYKGFEIQ
ncbi:hypothetical protein LTR41_010942 [Exophiala xenobiotica]|nr:hypothetical protein LTR41_010942 [Exophiala xenobiotica]KAK5551110.1 hypothetical protein LTR46_010863 [Exophiala xenobiotica]